MLNKIGGEHANSSKDLRMMFATYHNTETSILEKIDEKLVKFEARDEKKMNGKAKPNENADFDKDLENLSALVSVTLIIIGIMSTTLCVTICCLYKKKSRRKS